MATKQFLWVLTSVGLMVLTAGCKTGTKNFFSSNGSDSESRWDTYEAVQAAFDKVTPDQTTTNELRQLGFYPLASPNVKILTYVDIMQTFMPNPAITKEDLDPAVRACIDAKERSHAFQVNLRQVRTQRHGKLLPDILGFRRLSHESGWEFQGLILLTDEKVVYKLSSGQPQISREDRRTRPLGPFQEVEFSASGLVNMAK